MKRWIVAGWMVAAPAAVAVLWFGRPQPEHPDLWRQVAAVVGCTAAGLCGAWATVAYARLRGFGDPAGALAVAGLALLGVSFLTSPAVFWLGLSTGTEAQYVAWAVRLAALLLLAPYTVGYLWRRRE